MGQVFDLPLPTFTPLEAGFSPAGCSFGRDSAGGPVENRLKTCPTGSSRGAGLAAAGGAATVEQLVAGQHQLGQVADPMQFPLLWIVQRQ